MQESAGVDSVVWAVECAVVFGDNETHFKRLPCLSGTFSGPSEMVCPSWKGSRLCRDNCCIRLSRNSSDADIGASPCNAVTLGASVARSIASSKCFAIGVRKGLLVDHVRCRCRLEGSHWSLDLVVAASLGSGRGFVEDSS